MVKTLQYRSSTVSISGVVSECMRSGEVFSYLFSCVFCPTLSLSALPSLPLHCSLENHFRESVVSCHRPIPPTFSLQCCQQMFNTTQVLCKPCSFLWRCSVSSPLFGSAFAVKCFVDMQPFICTVWVCLCNSAVKVCDSHACRKLERTKALGIQEFLFAPKNDILVSPEWF